jgi:hypothetical protein
MTCDCRRPEARLTLEADETAELGLHRDVGPGDVVGLGAGLGEDERRPDRVDGDGVVVRAEESPSEVKLMDGAVDNHRPRHLHVLLGLRVDIARPDDDLLDLAQGLVADGLADRRESRVLALGEADRHVRQWALLGEFGELGPERLDALEVAVERLLAEAGLAGLSDLEGEVGVRRVGRDDDDGIDGRVGQDLLDRGGDLGPVRVRLTEADRGRLEGVVDRVKPGDAADRDDGVGMDCRVRRMSSCGACSRADVQECRPVLGGWTGER